MTREEKIKAFTMRIDGESWNAIAAELGANASLVRGTVLEAIRVKQAETRTRRCGTIVYPAIAQYLARNHMSIRGLWRKMGDMTTSPHLYHILYGFCTPRRETLARISDATGIPIEQLTREEAFHESHP